MKNRASKCTGRILPRLLTTAAVAFSVTVLSASAERPVKRVGPERAVGGITAQEQMARHDKLRGQLVAEMPDAALQARIRIELTQEDLADLAKPHDVVVPTPLRVGVVKTISPVVGAVRAQGFKGGVIQETDDGGFVWAVTITSPEAQAVRVHFTDFSLPPGAEMYFFSLNREAYGPYVGKGRNGNGDFWTRSISSDTGVIMLRYRGETTEADRQRISFVISEFGHIHGRPLKANDRDTWPCAGNVLCLIDANCMSGTPVDVAKDAVAKMEWVEGPYVYTCTGGLLADTDPSTQIPYFVTAHHCVSSDTPNLETYFHYITSSCEETCPGYRPPSTIGATVQATGTAGDFTLLTLNESPPSGTRYLGWSNAPVAFTDGVPLWRISNANFGPQVYSEYEVDTSSLVCAGAPRGQFIYSSNLDGGTMGGSSGAPIVNSSGEAVGQFLGCCGYNCGNDCDFHNNWFIDGALAFYWDSVAEFLDPPMPPCYLDKITAPDAASGAQFGGAAAMDHDVLVIGAPLDDEVAVNAGAAYVYRRSGTSWSFEQKLMASDGATEDRFGTSVAVSGDVIAVGAYLNDGVAPDSGAVYVFGYNGVDWDQEQKLAPPDMHDGDKFGYSVAADGNVLVGGAYASDGVGSDSGSAYVYRYGATWELEQKLLASDATSGDRFGWTVSVNGDYAVIGAPLADVVGFNSGAVYVYRYDGPNWTFHSKEWPSDAAASDNFGYSVSIDGGRFVAGAQSGDSPEAVDSGTAYVYRLDGPDWVEDQELHASDGANGDRFGTAVSLSEGVTAVGAYRNDEAGADAGAAYVYALYDSNWGQEAKLIAPDAAGGDQFGRSVATKRGFALAGAPYDADAGSETGAAYLYAAGTDCNLNRIPDICDIRDGFSEDLDDDGVPDDCCPIAPAPIAIPDVTETNRYISFRPGEGTQSTALRVTLVNVPGFTSFNGEHRWVDSPRQITEASGSSDPGPPPTFWGANLRCDPSYRDWSAVDVLHLFDEAILPGGTYAVQAIAEECDTASEDWYTVAVTMVTTPRWGDVVGDCGVTPCTDPNGVVDFIDISAVVEKFKNTPSAILKARADLDPDQPNAVIDFTDISCVVDAFRALPYPFLGPQACPP